MNIGIPELRQLRLVPVLLAIVLAQFILLALRIHLEPAPSVTTDFSGATVKLSADRAWTLLPGQCATLRWELEGIQSVYINGAGKVGHDEMPFCPTASLMDARFEITAAGGEARDFSFVLQSLPAALGAWTLMLGLVAPVLVAAYFLATMRLSQRTITDLSPFLLLAALLLSGLLLQTAQPHFIAGVLDQLAYIVKQRAWYELGIALAGVIYIPLAVQALRRGRQRGNRADIVAIGAFLLVLLLVFGAGVESIPQWEIWTSQAWLEGRESILQHEFVVRFWALITHTFATTLSPDGFAGYHVVIFFMFWGTLTLFYAILRQLGAPPWLAFLATILFLFYPVNSRLTSIRSNMHTLSRLALLAGAHLILVCREDPSRLRVLGVWLALLICLGGYDSGLALILVIPLLWWRQEPRRFWRNMNLTAIWYLVPVAKLGQVLLLLIDQRFFYGKWLISGSRLSDQISLDRVGEHLELAAMVYGRIFLEGWEEALRAISQNTWAVPTVATIALTGLTATILARETADGDLLPPPRKTAEATLAGILLILPAIGVFLLLGSSTDGSWRIFIFAPIGATIAVMGLATLATTVIRRARLRQALLICMCLLLLWPGLSRLYLQQNRHNQYADAKASVLRQIVEQAPGFHDEAHLILFTTLTSDELQALGLWELYGNVIDSAMYLLYQQRRPILSTVCVYSGRCSRFDTILRYMDRDFLGADEDYRDVVIFQLHEDLRVELLRELPPELRERDSNRYDPERWIDRSAPLPERARSLLAAAWRE